MPLPSGAERAGRSQASRRYARRLARGDRATGAPDGSEEDVIFDRLGAWADGTVLREAEAIDLAVYRAVAATPSPALDDAMRSLSSAADHSKLWLASAAALALFGGRAGRRAAVAGVGAIAVTSFIVNVPLKIFLRRARPDRTGARVPIARQVPMPLTNSLPSGHAASGFAFASAVAGGLPGIAAPLRTIASVVGYSRVHTGVHYPGDVIVGSLIGSTIGESVAIVVRRQARRRSSRSGQSLGDES
jgi:undecaprenyl-diphosphatase